MTTEKYFIVIGWEQTNLTLFFILMFTTEQINERSVLSNHLKSPTSNDLTYLIVKSVENSFKVHLHLRGHSRGLFNFFVFCPNPVLLRGHVLSSSPLFYCDTLQFYSNCFADAVNFLSGLFFAVHIHRLFLLRPMLNWTVPLSTRPASKRVVL